MTNPYKIDEGTEPLTDEEIKRLRPAPEVLDELGFTTTKYGSLCVKHKQLPKEYLIKMPGKVNND